MNWTVALLAFLPGVGLALLLKTLFARNGIAPAMALTPVLLLLLAMRLKAT